MKNFEGINLKVLTFSVSNVENEIAQLDQKGGKKTFFLSNIEINGGMEV